MAKFSAFAILVVFAACGPTRNNGDDTHGDGNTGGGDAAACATSSVKADKIPLDLFIMLDQSGSMADAVSGGTKWSTVTSALDTFVVTSASRDLSDQERELWPDAGGLFFGSDGTVGLPPTPWHEAPLPG